MRIWTLDEARGALPRVREIVERIRGLVATTAEAGDEYGSTNGRRPAETPEAAELREAVEALDSEGIVLRDPARGLIDFPARTRDGRDYLLCWLSGEPDIEWWHWPEDGFAGRRPLTDPPEPPPKPA